MAGQTGYRKYTTRSVQLPVRRIDDSLDLDLLTRSRVDRYPAYDLIGKGLLASKNAELVKILHHADGSWESQLMSHHL